MGGLFSKAGQRAVNSLLKLIGGKKALRKTLKEIIINSEGDMIKGIIIKSQQYKNLIGPGPEQWKGLQYIIRPHQQTNDKGETRVFMAVFLVPFNNSEQGAIFGDPLEAYTIDNFFDSLLIPFFEGEQSSNPEKEEA